MISGIGIDLVEIDRIQAVLKRNKRFPQRILTASELKIYQSYKGKRALQFLAGRFAAKEAYSKAFGTGIGQISFQDIEVLPNELGQPELTEHPSSDQALISITHTDKIAAAQVLLQSI